MTPYFASFLLGCVVGALIFGTAIFFLTREPKRDGLNLRHIRVTVRKYDQP